MTGWIAFGPDSNVIRACVMMGRTLISTITAASEAEALTQARAALPPQSDIPVIRIADGTSDRMPAALIPTNTLNIAALSQSSPQGLIGAWPRLWAAGIAARDPHWDGIVCLCRTDVTHWIYISAGEAISSLSTLTPKLINTLGGTTSRVSIPALSDSLSRPERLAADLYQAQLRIDTQALTGHLLGAELAATRAYWLGRDAVVIDDTGLGDIYTDALRHQGVPVDQTQPANLLAPAMTALTEALNLNP